MNLVILTHPAFNKSQSMPRFTKMLAEGMRERGHAVKLWSPIPRFLRIPAPIAIKKWLGYVDQYIIFPFKVQGLLKKCPPDTLFIFTDQALGPWVPLVAERHHVIHCHDFLALKSALGEVKENPTSWTGCQYQALIRWGFSKGSHFISVSSHTNSELQRFLPKKPVTSAVVYNQVASVFQPRDPLSARHNLSEKLAGVLVNSASIKRGYLLHVGATVWYKNKRGVLELYQAWRKISNNPLPLIMIGDLPSEDLIRWVKNTSWGRDVIFLTGVQEELMALAYSGATVFLFPSLEEGFGWPIAEAMASACPVITTNKPPMTEVGGNAAFYISRRPEQKNEVNAWAENGAMMIEQLVNMSSVERQEAVNTGLQNVGRFSSQAVLDQIDGFYKQIVSFSQSPSKVKR